MKVGVYMYTIKDLQNFDYIPDDTLYVNDDWYVSTHTYLIKILTKFYGKRELQIDDDLILENLDKIKNNTFISDVLVDVISDNIDTLFILNKDKYIHMYDTLTAEYNPLWNVDGTETLIYTKDNTGNQNNNETVGGTVRTITDNTGTVSDSGGNSGTSTDSATTYESDVFLDANKTEDSYITSNTRTDNLKQDTTQTNNLTNGNTRTDNLHESYSETKTRGGNIGVTMSQQLIIAEMELRDKYNFMEILCHDIANTISYSVY